MDIPASKPRSPPLQELLDVLAQSEADIAAGRVHELEDVLREIDNDIAELEEASRLEKMPLAGR